MRRNERLANEMFYPTWEDYLENEIRWGVAFMRGQGITPRHFAYPHDNRTAFTDQELFKVFVSLRMGGRGCYASMDRVRLVHSMFWGRRPDDRHSGHEFTATYLKTQQYIFPYFRMPVQHRLEYLVQSAKMFKAPFLTFDQALGTEIPA